MPFVCSKCKNVLNVSEDEDGLVKVCCVRCKTTWYIELNSQGEVDEKSKNEVKTEKSE